MRSETAYGPFGLSLNVEVILGASAPGVPSCRRAPWPRPDRAPGKPATMAGSARLRTRVVHSAGQMDRRSPPDWTSVSSDAGPGAGLALQSELVDEVVDVRSRQIEARRDFDDVPPGRRQLAAQELALKGAGRLVERRGPPRFDRALVLEMARFHLVGAFSVGADQGGLQLVA